MRTRGLISGCRVVAIGILMSLVLIGSASAGPGGGGHGGGGGGFHGGGGSVHGGSRGSFGHYFGGGYRGGYYGSHGYYGGRYGYGRWRGGWNGFGFGLYVPFLPWGYETLWWGGVPYYYANDDYYLWDDSVGEYQEVQPPAGPPQAAPDGVSGPSDLTATAHLFAYPKGGQSPEQQARDRDECRHWAQSQTGFDSMQAQTNEANDSTAKRQGYLRAEAACLEGRNYSVK